MTQERDNLDPAFVEQQRRRLMAMRKQLLRRGEQVEDAELSVEEEHGDEAGEFEERAQEATEREVDQALHQVEDRRLHAVERALQKIDEGTYGRSDVSGKAIPRARLEAIPEAVTLKDEQPPRIAR